MGVVSPIVSEANDSPGKRIYRARAAKGWSLEALAGKVGVSKVTVWAWEQDRCRPRLPTFERLSAALGRPVESLLHGGDSVEPALPDLIADCRARIAQAVGLKVQDVEIRISFSSQEA